MKKIWMIIVIILVLIVGGVSFYQNKANNSPSDIAKETKQEISKEILSYTHPDIGFSFNYPANYKMTNLADDGGESILLQDNGKGLQIYISDFTAKVNFDSALVKKEMPNENFEDLKDIQMPNGFSAVSFSAKDASLGATSNIWFVKDKKLYQITAQADQTVLFKSISESLKFEN